MGSCSDTDIDPRFFVMLRKEFKGMNEKLSSWC